jgi:hypothetical protein
VVVCGLHFIGYMKALILGVLLVSSVAGAKNLSTGKQVKETEKAKLPRDLAAHEVRDRMKVVDADVSACYLNAVGERPGAGRLEIKLAIHRTGLLDRIDVATPNLPEKLSLQIESCVKTAVKGLAFPERRNETVAVVPYFYQRIKNPGPQYSCWDPKGCKTR